MEILWYEGFEQYGPIASTGGDTALAQGLWDEASDGLVNTVEVRTGLYAFQGLVGFVLRRSLGGDFEYVGSTFGMWLSQIPNKGTTGHVLSQFCDVNNVEHVGIRIGTTGRVEAWRNQFGNTAGAFAGVLLGRSTLEIAPGTYNHFDVKVHIHATAGTVKVRVNGIDFIALTGLNTVGHGTATLGSQVRWGYFNGAGPDFNDGRPFWLDDIVAIHYADDGSEESTFLGQYGVYFLKPIADTATADWQLTSGIHGYALINEVPPDDNASFIYSPTTGNKSAFVCEPLPVNVTSVAAVAALSRAEKTDAGAATMQMAIVSGGTEYDEGSVHGITTSWSYYLTPSWQQDPFTMADWVPTNMPNILVERTA